MKMYSIPKGTEAILLTNWKDTDKNGTLESKQWETRKDLSFFTFLADPVWVANGNEHEIPIITGLAKAGYGIYVDEENPEKYAIAVDYRAVRID